MTADAVTPDRRLKRWVSARSVPPPEQEPPTTLGSPLTVGRTAAEFATVFDCYGGEIYRYCARRIGAELADDVVAETFMVAYERRHRFDPARGAVLPWLYGIATNVVRRHRASEARYLRVQAAAVGTAPGGDGFVDRAAERMDADATVRALSGELARVPRRQRDVLMLYAAGLSYAEIVTALGIPPGTVMSRLHRARARLRRALAELGIHEWNGKD
jgi:RNA polymerase sigma factor (sigma-70 family)